MRLYPAIDIKDGKCVRLFKGLFDQQTVFSDKPAEVAEKWESLGASYIHVVDLDGALDGKWGNRETVKSIVRSVKVPVQTGGGIRTLTDIKDRLDIGVSRVIIGTMAVKDPSFVKAAVEVYGSASIAVGIDAKDGKVATHGWEKVSELEAIEFAKQMKDLGVKVVIYTDISRDGTMEGVNLEATKAMVEETGMEIIASGGVSSMEDLHGTSDIGAAGTIIGKALYLDAIDLKEAVDIFERGE